VIVRASVSGSHLVGSWGRVASFGSCSAPNVRSMVRAFGPRQVLRAREALCRAELHPQGEHGTLAWASRLKPGRRWCWGQPRPRWRCHTRRAGRVMVQITVLRNADEVAVLGDAWTQLTTDFDSPMLTHEWVMAALEHLATTQSVTVVCVFDGEELVAAAPLAGPLRPFARLGLVGQEEHAEPGGFIFRDPEALGRLIDGVATLRRPMILRGIASDSPVVDGLRRLARSRVVTRAHRTCPTLELSRHVDGVKALLSASLRSDLRRARRRAESLGAVDFEMHAPTSAAALEPLWREVLRVESAGWKGRSGTALRHHNTLGPFFAGYAGRALRHKELRIGLLTIDGRAVAAVVATERHDRLWLLKTGYDEALASASPGMLALQETVAYSWDRGLRSLEFLGDSAPWTRRWTRSERPFVVVKTYPHTPLGAALLTADAARSIRRRLSPRRGRR